MEDSGNGWPIGGNSTQAASGSVGSPNGTGTARVIREAPPMRDPASEVPGMPPNFGRFAVPHVVTLQGLATAISRTYRVSDEALQHAMDNARWMRNDVGIMECIETRQRSVALLDWHLEPDDQDSQDQRDLCAELEKILRRIPTFLKYRENLLHAIWHGRYAVQHKYEWMDVCGRQRVAPARWLPVNGDKLVYRIEDDPFRSTEQVGIRVGPSYQAGQIVNGRHKVEPTERGLAYFLDPWERQLLAIHTHQVEDGAFESPWEAGKIHGVGIRSRIYWEWFQKQELLGFLIEYLERASFGVEMWYYPLGNEAAKKEVEAAAKERLGNGRSIVLVPRPIGDDGHAYGMERIEPGLGGVEAIKDLLGTYFGHRIKRYILGQTLTSEADATGLGSGVAEIHLGTFMDIVRYDATNLEETVTNDLVKLVKNWNFPRAKKIGVRFKIDTESQNAREKLQAYREAWEMGAQIKEKDVLDTIGAAMPTENDRVLQNPQIQQQERLWQQAQQQIDDQQAAGHQVIGALREKGLMAGAAQPPAEDFGAGVFPGENGNGGNGGMAV